MKRFYLMMLLCFTVSLCASAQIGYQVSLLNNATGEARANERVTVTVKITDSDGNIVCEETKDERSNDFGVVSMSVGDSETFTNADWSKLPFFIEASVDGRLLGKSQLLSVPVAEYAKKTGQLTTELLCSKNWIYHESYDHGYSETIFTFNHDGSYIKRSNGTPYVGMYHIDGNNVHYSEDEGHIHTLSYSAVWNCLFWSEPGYVFK